MASRGTWRLIYLLVGVLLLAYTVYARELMGSLALLVFILVGALLIVKGLRLR